MKPRERSSFWKVIYIRWMYSTHVHTPCTHTCSWAPPVAGDVICCARELRQHMYNYYSIQYSRANQQTHIWGLFPDACLQLACHHPSLFGICSTKAHINWNWSVGCLRAVENHASKIAKVRPQSLHGTCTSIMAEELAPALPTFRKSIRWAVRVLFFGSNNKFCRAQNIWFLEHVCNHALLLFRQQTYCHHIVNVLASQHGEWHLQGNCPCIGTCWNSSWQGAGAASMWGSRNSIWASYWAAARGWAKVSGRLPDSVKLYEGTALLISCLSAQKSKLCERLNRKQTYLIRSRS